MYEKQLLSVRHGSGGSLALSGDSLAARETRKISGSQQRRADMQPSDPHRLAESILSQGGGVRNSDRQQQKTTCLSHLGKRFCIFLQRTLNKQSTTSLLKFAEYAMNMEPPHSRCLSRGAPQQSSTSLLERLPVELRLQIYDLLFPTKCVPYHAISNGTLRHDTQPTSTKILRLNRDVHAEASSYLYARTPFEVRINPNGIQLCGGRHMTYPAYDFGKHGGPDKIHSVPHVWDRLLRNVRRLELRLTAWVQRDMFDMVAAYLQYFVARLLNAGANLDSIRVAVEWQNGVSNFPISRPSVEMARKLLQPLTLLKGLREVRFGRIDPLPVGFEYSAGYYSVTEEEQYRELREWLKGEMERRT
ncbi:hypothetical protein IWX49DRAFT_140501 [Phyllosticta citricarpa]|uniref:F-box domain-containing protein n=1 Tax=Phyllosticta paracitricarpa TaxID=2016321 RepID=A0ABR1N8A5_9PEZI